MLWVHLRLVFIFNDKYTKGSSRPIWAERKEIEEKRDCNYVGRVGGHNIEGDE